MRIAPSSLPPRHVDSWTLSFALMTTGAFCQNIGKLFSELTLVTDNFLSPKNIWLKLYMCALLHLIDHASSLLQEVELLEACFYGMVEQAHYLLTTGVNVNVTQFVSGLLDRDFFNSRFSVVHSGVCM